MFKPLGRKRRNRLKLKSNKTSLVNNDTAKTFREYWKAMTERCPMEEKTLESWDNEMALNLTAPFMLSKHFAGSMKKKGHSSGTGPARSDLQRHLSVLC